MKRVVLTLCMVLSAIFIVAGEMFTVGNYSFYPLSPSETAIVRANDSITSANIPSTVTYQDTTYRVTRISSLAFLGCTALKDVTISEGVISIGSLAFKKCSSLTSITIPSTVTSIGDQVFEECKSLISVMMSDGLENIGTNAFLECSSLTDITIPTSVMNIGCDAFKGTGIYNNPSNWQNGALYIDDCLISVNADYVGEFVVVPNTHLIADDAFCRARKVSSVVMPNTVTSIGNRAFWMCELLQSITIPASVKYIGDWALSVCTSLTSINFEGTTEEWSAISKGDSWNYEVPATYVQCSDGQVKI